MSLTLTREAESSTAVLNTALGKVHPHLQADDWDDDFALPQLTTTFSVGDGRHGKFTAEAEYLTFHKGTYAGDHVIKIDTDDYPELAFTEFKLEAPWVIQPTGSKPLVIRSLSTVTIAGTIDCSGDDGNASDVKTISPAGATGRCGGSAGGAGGSTSATAAAGSAPATNAASAGGAGVAEGDGGGGGGGMDQSAPGPVLGKDVTDTGAGGAAGTPGNDSGFTTEGGGAGGGGGAVYQNIADPGAHSSGASGGAGGGTILIYAVGNVSVAGTVKADGGDGGATGGSGKGGAGGGGAGGSVLLFSGGTLTIDGTVTAKGGTGGASTGGNGGDGGVGRLWTIDGDGNPTLGGASVYDPFPVLPTWGAVNSRTGTLTLVTKQYDLDNTSPLVKSVSLESTISGASTVKLEVATSDAPFTEAEASWQEASNLFDKPIKRYVRFKVTLNNQSETSPATVERIDFEYEKQDQTRFDFSSCQKGTVGAPGGRPPGSLFVLLFMPLLLALGLRRPARAYQPKER